MNVYLVHGTSGDYSERTDWTVEGWLALSYAERRVAELTAATIEFEEKKNALRDRHARKGTDFDEPHMRQVTLLIERYAKLYGDDNVVLCGTYTVETVKLRKPR